MAEPYYTTAAALRTELGGISSSVLSDAAALVIIQKAEDETDRLLGARPVDESTLRKVVQEDVEDWQWSLLTRAATLLAAELYRTPDLLTRARYRREKGPDFEVQDPLTGTTPQLVTSLLNDSGLRVLSGRALPGTAYRSLTSVVTNTSVDELDGGTP